MARTSRPKRFMFVFFAFSLMFSSLAAVVPSAGAQTSPPPIDYCDYSQKTGSGDVASWLASAPLGANTDCIDIWIEARGCGFLDIRLENRINLPPWTHTLKWTEGQQDIWSLRRDVSTDPIVFPDGYNDGQGVWVTVVLVTPERDWVDYAGDDAQLYWSGNAIDQTFFIPTDCSPPTEVQWCSPGYWKNNTSEWPVDVETTMFATAFPGEELTDKKGNGYDEDFTTLMYVLQNPQLFGGGMTERVASYLSSLYGYSGTVPTGDLPVVCPLPGDGN